MHDLNALVGTHDLLLLTLDTLRYDVAREELEAGHTPTLAALLPGGRWEERHSPASFTYAAHQAFFAGFLPTPVTPGRHPRPFALRFEGSETTGPGTCVLDAPDLVTGLAGRGHHNGYPHKTAYRPLTPALPLEDVWAKERRDALFLYLHVPFCEMRCGFCNLFTAAGPKEDVVQAWLAALKREARRVKEALGSATFARAALGGGTPTLLDVAGLETVFDLAAELGVDPRDVPMSVEVSPETVDAAKVAVLKARGVDRVSMGVQSFLESEVAAVKRPQKTAQVEATLDVLQSAGFPTLNLDLIYGIEGQTLETFLHSLEAALRYAPEELYLYPLYVRPLTFLGKKSRAWDDLRLSLYRAGRDFLLARGYTQVSMRMFRAAHAPAARGAVYRCQEDGMVGLGVGARSYAGAVHCRCGPSA